MTNQPKFEAFKQALHELCLTHRVQILVDDRDDLHVTDLLAGEEPLALSLFDGTHLPGTGA
jgi:hypothetical protein